MSFRSDVVIQVDRMIEIRWSNSALSNVKLLLNLIHMFIETQLDVQNVFADQISLSHQTINNLTYSLSSNVKPIFQILQ